MGRKKTLLLGWLTRGVLLAVSAAQACRDAVKRYELAGGTRRSASARAWVARRSWAGFVGACTSGRAGGLARKAKLAWAAASPYSFLSLFLFFFYFFPFSFICCQFV